MGIVEILLIICLCGLISIGVSKYIKKESPKAREKRLREAQLKREMEDIKDDIESSPNNQ